MLFSKMWRSFRTFLHLFSFHKVQISGNFLIHGCCLLVIKLIEIAAGISSTPTEKSLLPAKQGRRLLFAFVIPPICRVLTYTLPITEESGTAYCLVLNKGWAGGSGEIFNIAILIQGFHHPLLAEIFCAKPTGSIIAFLGCYYKIPVQDKKTNSHQYFLIYSTA